jgi:hypothetical protein
MSISPHHKILIRLCILCTLVACLWFFSGKANTAQFEKQIPVTTDQLPSENGVIPVELRCEDAKLSAPNALEKLACVIKNNTNKYISAATINISVIFEKEGKPSTDSSFLTIETFVHPDFRDEHKDNLIPPRGERRFQDLPSSYDGAVINVVTVRIDYIEFADNAMALGPNHAGARIISNIRTGAAKYRDWLVQKYNQSGGVIDAITPLLEKDQPIPPELDIQNGDEQQGVVSYRNYARKTYQTKGIEGLIKHLRQTTAPVNK